MAETAQKRKSWTRVAFGDVVRLSKERSKDPAADGLDRYVGLEHLDPGDLKVRRWGDVAEGTTFTSVFRPGQVLFGKRRAYQRKVAVADFAGVCSGDIYVLEPKDPDILLPELLPFICQTDSFFEHAIGTSAGSLSPRTNWKSLAKYEFALPPLGEQHGIAAAAQRIRHIEDAYHNLAERAAGAANALLAHDVYLDPTGDLSSPRPRLRPGWRWLELGEVVKGTKAGLFKRKDLYGTGKNIVGVSDLYHHRSIDGQSFAAVPATQAEAAEYMLEDGDLVYGESSLVRSGIARVLWVTAAGAGTLFAWHTRRLRLDRDRVCAGFLSTYLNSPVGRRDILSRATTTVLTGITVEDFLSVPIPVAEFGRQERLRDMIESVWEAQSLLSGRREDLKSMKSSVSSRLERRGEVGQ